MSERRRRYTLARLREDQGEDAEGAAGRLLDVRLSGSRELVAEALAVLRLVLDVAEESRPYPNRRGAPGGLRVYLRALGLTPEARDFLRRWLRAPER